MNLSAQGQPKSMVIEAVVVRADGSVQDLGVIAYYHSNPLKRLLWRVKRFLGRV